ncbi:unnamed protein product [Parnassius mnemosyne]|uniref:unspecific monooxygenase n=1 Tax=Parnassius mnemosyne TaxID=213953 RepID=A0AAV1LRG9_9NEOP
MIVEILVFIVMTLIVYYTYIHKRMHKYFLDRDLKYNPGIPLFGNVFQSTFLKRHMVEDIDAVYREFPNEKYVGYIEGTSPIILIRDPEVIKHITVKDFDHFVNHKMFFPEDIEPMFGDSIFMMKDDKWRDMLTMLSPSFTGSKIRQMMPFMTDISKNVIQYLKDHISEDIDVGNLMRRYTNDVIASCAFGCQVNSLKDKENDFYKIGQALFTMNSTWQRFKLFFVMHIPKVARLLGMQVFTQEYSSFFNNLITTTMEHREKYNIERPDMIQLLVQASKGNLKPENVNIKDDIVVEAEKLKQHGALKQWTQRELASQLFIFFLGGFESSATALTMCIHELAINPVIQKKLYEEIKSFKEKNSSLVHENINDLKYLDCVINETLRRWAPALIMDRVCTKAYELPQPREGGIPCKLRPGDVVYNVVNSIHMDPKYYPDPEVFDPDRFSDERRHEIKPFTFMPFGIGPRACIGSRFALLELKVLIYHLILNFKILKCNKTTDPIVLKPQEFNINAIGGTWVRLENRY